MIPFDMAVFDLRHLARQAVRSVAVFGIALAAALPAAAVSISEPHPVTARLVPELSAVAPGTTLWVDLHLDIAPGWHTYWRNPGDAGLPTEIAWTLPADFSAKEIVWPTPERFVVEGLGNYGYRDAADLLVPITVSRDVKPGETARLDAAVSWLVCSDICIPGDAKLTLALPVAGAAVFDLSAKDLFAAARSRLPKPAPFEARFAARGNGLRLIMPSADFAPAEQPRVTFFPFDANVIDAAAEPKLERRGDALELLLQRASTPAAMIPKSLDGVLVMGDAKGGAEALSLHATPAAALPVAESADEIAWWQALLFALFGGIVLNLMPCVFPVLSLKLVSLAGIGGRAAHHHAAAYTAGVILSFAALGGALLILRAGGSAIGWGFQLQSPVVVGLLAYLLFAMGLSLSGVAEFGMGLAGIGGRFAGREGLGGAFATGVLATIVATPCTAPFMGAALGFALLAPTPLALAIFVMLGIGLALPLAVASMIPAVTRLLPRPGRWMVLLKQLLAFPLYGTVAWLVWVLIQEVGPEGALMALFGLVLVGFAVWVYGTTRLAGPAMRRAGAALAVAGTAAALVLAVSATPSAARPEQTATTDGLSYERFSQARLDALTAEHRPVFVNLTAAWCITCLVNEHVTLDTTAIRQAFAEHNIVALKGDWTRQDPEITAWLQQFGRSGVPLYLLYDRSGTANVLPQILTQAGVLAAIDKIGALSSANSGS